MSQPSSRDAELLSAYLDGQLSKPDSARLESRLKTDPELRTVYEGLRQSLALLRKLPARRAPRNFTLTPKMAGVKPPLPRAFPVFRLASALAAVLFFIGYALNLSTPLLASAPTVAPLAASAPAAVEMVAAPTEEALQTFAPKIAATQDVSAATQNDLAPTASPEAMTLAVPPSEGMSQRNVYSPPAEPLSLPVDPVWLFVLLGLAVVSGASAFIIRARTDQDWSKANAANLARPGTRDRLLIVLVVVAILLLIAAVYWMATDFSASLAWPLNSGSTAVAQEIPIEAGMGYDFTITDDLGMVTAISFPENAIKEATVLHFTLIMDITLPDRVAYSFPNRAFALFPPPGSGSLEAPMTIRMGYGDDVSSVADENKLALYWWSGDQWRDAAATCAPVSTYTRLPASHQISVPVCQFGTFLLVAP